MVTILGDLEVGKDAHSEWGLPIVEWKEGEWLDLGLGISGKKLVDPTEWHVVAVVGMEVELEKLSG
jgi:hypothetical protein